MISRTMLKIIASFRYEEMAVMMLLGCERAWTRFF